MSKKYELTSDSITMNGHIVYRIRALRSFSDVKAGDLGGYVESEKNLSQDDNSWVYYIAKASGDACVYGNARISGGARVTGSAQVFGNAWVFGNT